jgi:8-amino-7-oxononanoate synthase
MEGKRRIMLGSNNYLGLTTNPEVIEAGLRALEEYGSGCSGSRFLNGTLNLHLQLEKELAEFLGKEAVMCFSTGYQSNLGIISALVNHGDYIVMDRENHASLYDACRLSFGKMVRFRHNDMADLEQKLTTVPETAGCLIVTDGVFSMGGDIANLPEICRLARKYGARVMVDDAHGLGVIGKGGRGTASYYGLEDEVDIYMGTFSKSLASLGGYMATSARVIDYVKHCSRPFIFSASITPASCASALAALNILRNHPELPETLQARALFMRQKLKEAGIRTRETNGERIPIIPIYTYELTPTLVVAKDLYERGVYVNPTLPPAVAPGECLLRTSLMASHTEALIEEAVGIIADVLKEHHIGD